MDTGQTSREKVLFLHAHIGEQTLLSPFTLLMSLKLYNHKYNKASSLLKFFQECVHLFYFENKN
jgi:hypothetical protein